MYGKGRKGRGLGYIHFFRGGPAEGVVVEEGYFLGDLFGSEGWMFM